MDTTSQANIRPALPTDIPTIASILHAAFAEYEPIYTPGGFAATTCHFKKVVRQTEGNAIGCAGGGR